MPPIILVMAGGAAGSALRHLVGRVALARFGPGFPWGTLSVNLIGGCVMGLLAGVLARHAAGEPARLLVGVGLLGGFTTFSAFTLETVLMVQRGEASTAVAYVAASVAGAMLALFAGMRLAQVAA